MATDIATLAPHPTRAGERTPRRTPAVGALITLARRRASLTASNPRQILVPLLTPILLATVIAPALKKALGGLHTNIDYISFVSVGTVGLLVPFATTFAGLSVIDDRDSGAQRELLAAPIRRALLVFGNLAVVMVLAAFQVVTVIAVAALRGGEFNIRPAGVLWFAAATVMFVVMMYGIAEAPAAKIHHQEEYIGATPVIAILPWFFAGALFPIGVLPGAIRVREIASAHARDGVDALRARRSPRHWPTRHLGDTQHNHIGVVEPRRGARVRRGLHRSGRSRLHPLGGEVMRTVEAATAG